MRKETMIPREFAEELSAHASPQEIREHVEAQCRWVREAVEASRLKFTDDMDVVTSSRCGTAFDGQHQITIWQTEMKGKSLHPAHFWVGEDGRLYHQKAVHTAGCESPCTHPVLFMPADLEVIQKDFMGYHILWVASVELAHIHSAVH